MIEYIKGILTETTEQKITIELGGLGYGLFISLATHEKLPKLGEPVHIYVSTVIREDSHKMYGFLTRGEKSLFEMLNNISGIGPRISIGMLGSMTLEDLHMAVVHENAKALSKIPGIGKKMAERLILELRDKLPKMDKKNLSLPKNGVTGDAILALINTG